MTVPDDAWLPAVGRWCGAPVTVRRREPLAGGYASDGVERIDLDAGGRAVSIVLKRGSAVETAAMRALAVVRGVARPALIAAGADWLVVAHHDGPPLPPGGPVPDEVWDVLARVHAHWYRKRPRGVPVVDGAWWRGLCDRTVVAVRGAAARTGDPVFTAAERAVAAWREDAAVHTALAVLPRTLVHGDAHRGNVLLDPDGAVLIDWGNARVAAPGLDLAVLRAQGAGPPPAYTELFAELTAGGCPPAVRALEDRWADLHAHVQYLGFAADHLGADRVAEMTAVATGARAELGSALAVAL